MQTYKVTVRDNVGATWDFRCHADDMRHAASQALAEPTVTEVLAVHAVANLVIHDTMQRNIDALNAAEEILRTAENSWSAIMGILRLRLGPLAHISTVTEFLD